jgi:hypothetical protein
MIHKEMIPPRRWLLFFYSLPSKPVGNRLKIWRKLSQLGAVSFKGSAYLLPDKEENYETLQWLGSEVISRGGEVDLVRADRFEFMPEEEIIHLFNRSREKEYQPIAETLETVERGLLNFKQGGAFNPKKLFEDFTRLVKDFEAVRKVDFFCSKKGTALEKRIKTVQETVKNFANNEKVKTAKLLESRHRQDYRGKIWVTRKRPYVDRMASAWLIRKFIDPEAVFKFIGEGEGFLSKGGRVAFDLKNGEFTHYGDLCTFEVLIKSFGLKDYALKKMAEVVHQIDLKDEKYPAPEAKGVEEILKGIRRTTGNDQEMLEKGMALFEMLYVSKTT